MEKAISYLMGTEESIPAAGDLFQLAVLELIRKACKQSAGLPSMKQNKNRLLRILYNLADPTLNSLNSTAVGYDLASTIVSLSGNAQALQIAVGSYVSLLREQSDNNVKLI